MELEENDFNILLNNLNFPLIIKDNIFLEFSKNCFNELNNLINETNLIKQSKMGLNNNNWENNFFRG